MKLRPLFGAVLLLTAGMVSVAGLAVNPRQVRADDDPPAAAGVPTHGAKAVPVKAQDEDELRIEGEKRFHANCGRCHQYPHKFPPRMMATIVRHMRVRATITDEDMRLVLRYMTQ